MLSWRSSCCGQALPRCVKHVAPAATARSKTSVDAFVWPRLTLIPSEVASAIASNAFLRSGARVSSSGSFSVSDRSWRIFSGVGSSISAGSCAPWKPGSDDRKGPSTCQPAIACSSSVDLERSTRKWRRRAVNFVHSSVTSVSRKRQQPAARNARVAVSNGSTVKSSR